MGDMPQCAKRICTCMQRWAIYGFPLTGPVPRPVEPDDAVPSPVQVGSDVSGLSEAPHVL